MNDRISVDESGLWPDGESGRDAFRRSAVFHDGVGGESIGLLVEFERLSDGEFTLNLFVVDEVRVDGRFGDCSLDVQRVTVGPSIAPDGRLGVFISGTE